MNPHDQRGTPEAIWEPLPADTEERCRRAIAGPGHILCGEKAAWIRYSRCGCGERGMTRRHCAKHHAVHLQEELDQAELHVTDLVAALRAVVPSFRNDEEVLLAAGGVTMHMHDDPPVMDPMKKKVLRSGASRRQ